MSSLKVLLISGDLEVVNMPVNSCLQFNGYEVSRLHYEPVETDISEFNLRPEFKKSITELDENNYIVDLSVSFAPAAGAPLPFIVDVAIRGHFFVESENTAIKDALISDNTVAIMFPYLRMLVSCITNMANITPVLLPVINLSQALNDKASDN